MTKLSKLQIFLGVSVVTRKITKFPPSIFPVFLKDFETQSSFLGFENESPAFCLVRHFEATQIENERHLTQSIAYKKGHIHVKGKLRFHGQCTTIQPTIM